MQSKDGTRIAKLLGEIQAKLRAELLDELLSSEGDLEYLFDPQSYNLTLEELRECVQSQTFSHTCLPLILCRISAVTSR